MASTYTVNIGIEKPGTGDQSGTWGSTTNTNFDIIDQATNGVATVTLAAAGTSGSPNTLLINNGALSDGRNRFIEFNDGADLGATAYVQLDPSDAEKIVHIRNNLSASRSLILFQGTYNASNDFEVPNGADVLVKFDGGGAGATVTDVNVNLTPTKLTTSDADINGGDIDGTTIGASSAAAITGTTITGTSFVTSGDMTFGDDDKAIFGAGSDLQIYHDGSNSYVDDAGAGSLYIRSDGVMQIQKYTGEVMQTLAADGAVTLYYDNVPKLATTATGVDVTGTVTADGLTVDSDSATATIKAFQPKFILDDDSAAGAGSDKLIIQSAAGQSDGDYEFVLNNDQTSSADRTAMKIKGNGDISFYADDGTTQGLFFDASTQRLGLGTTAPSSIFHTEENTTGASIVRHKNTSNTSGAHSRFILQNGGTSGGDALINLDTQASGSRFTLGVDRSANKFVIANADKGSFDGSDEALVITSGGNVGIGESNPATPLHITATSPSVWLSGGATGQSNILLGPSSDADEGSIFYEQSNNALGFRANAAERMRIDSSGNVAIGVSSPNEKLTVSGNIELYNDEQDGYIWFHDAGTRSWTIGSQQSTGSFVLTNAVDVGSGEKIVVDSSGNLLVGKTSEDATTVGSTMRPNGGIVSVRDGDTNVVLNRKTSDGTIIDFRKDGTTVGSIAAGSGGFLTIGSPAGTPVYATFANGTFKPTTSTGVNDDGSGDLGNSSSRWKDLYLSGGVYLGGTGSANFLDDYEEGSWSPTITMSTTNPSVTYSRQHGSYVKVGTIVTCHFNIYATSLSGGSGNVQLSNLPFTSTNTAGNGSEARRPVVYLGFATGTGWSSATPRTALVQANSTNAVFYTAGSSDVRENFATALTTLPSTMNIYGSVTYISA
jgi:hypothetical protein